MSIQLPNDLLCSPLYYDEATGQVIVRSLDELRSLARLSPVPVVVGGGVKTADLPALAATGVAGFFVVSAVASAPEPAQAANELSAAWDAAARPSSV